MPCKHAENMMIYAKQAAEMDEPWKLWQSKIGGTWEHLIDHPQWCKTREYRQTPKTLSINGIDVPEPMREKPEIGTEYWYIDPCEDDLCDWSTWGDDEIDNNRFKNGVCHLTRDNCILHAKALFSFSEVG